MVGARAIPCNLPRLAIAQPSQARWIKLEERRRREEVIMSGSIIHSLSLALG